MNEGLQEGYQIEMASGLKTVGCIETDSGVEDLKYAPDRSFVYQRTDGILERIEVEDIEITVDETDPGLCKDAFELAKAKLEETGVTIAGIIFASEGVVAVDTDLNTAYLVALPTCEVSI